MKESNTTHSSIKACTNCRRLHRKCERNLPQCTHCLKIGKTCTYETLGKRGPKSKYEYNTPYPEIVLYRTENTSSEKRSTQPQATSPPPNLSLYDVPFIPKERLVRAFTYVEHDWKCIPYTGSTPNSDEMLLVYAIQSVMYIAQGQQFKAKKMYEKCKEFLVGDFDRVVNSFLLAACFTLLGFYCCFVSEFDRALFFLENVKLFLRKNQSRANTCVNYLQMLYGAIAQMISEDINIERSLKCLVMQQVFMREFAKKEHVLESDSHLLSALAEVDLVDSEIAEKMCRDVIYGTNDYELNAERLGDLCGKLTGMGEKLKLIFPEALLEAKRVECTLLVNGVRLQQSIRESNLELTSFYADSIAHLAYSPVTKNISTGSVVLLAANAHLHILAHSDITIRAKMLDKLQLEMDALRELRARVQGLSKRYDGTLQRLMYELGGVNFYYSIHLNEPQQPPTQEKRVTTWNQANYPIVQEQTADEALEEFLASFIE